MSYPVRFTLSLVLFIAFIFFGFMFLLRGCLSKYDERSIHPKVLYFENHQSKVVFAILQFDKTTSYTQNGGFISKSVNTYYSIQTNDAMNGEKINEKEIKEHGDIKNYPVEILGAAGNYAWVFMGEPMVFDPFTLNTIASVKELEEKNPLLKNKFPDERRYYRFDNNDHNLYITARDGSAWMIDGRTLKASQQESTEQGVEGRIKQIEKLLKENLKRRDTLMETRLRRPSKQLAAKEIDLKTYRQFTEAFHRDRQIADAEQDSLYKLKNALEAGKRSAEELVQRAASLRGRFQFSQAKLNGDTVSGVWIAIYSDKEIEELYERFSYGVAYNETARRQWYTSSYITNKQGDIIIEKEKVRPGTCIERYLDGGFLVDNNTGLPIRFTDGSRLIIFKNQVGHDGKIQLGKLNSQGVLKWTFDTGMSEWANYLFTGNQLIITARDNKELSGDECNILLLINLEKGRAERYDYFRQKKK